MSALERGRGASEPRLPVSPQLAFRVAIIGGLAMVMFGVIFFRLWYLQVLSGEQYVQQANANRVRDLPIAAPRGQILDSEGQPIVGSRTTNAVQVVPSEMPAALAKQVAEYRLSLVGPERRYRAAGEAARASKPRRREARRTRPRRSCASCTACRPAPPRRCRASPCRRCPARPCAPGACSTGSGA